MTRHKGTARKLHEQETGSQKTEDLNESRSLHGEKASQNIVLPKPQPANIFQPHKRTIQQWTSCSWSKKVTHGTKEALHQGNPEKGLVPFWYGQQ